MIDDKKMREKVIAELGFYGRYIKLEDVLKKRVANLKENLDDGYRSSFGAELGSAGHIKTDDHIVETLSRIERMEKEIKINRLRKDYIEEALQQLEEWESKLVKQVYIDKTRNMNQYGITQYIERSTAYRRKTYVLDKLAILLFPEEFYVLSSEELDEEIRKRMRPRRNL